MSVLLSWTQNTNKGNVTYSFEIDPPVSEMFSSGTNILLHVLYNTLYNVTIFATNCEGTARNFSEIYYGKCITIIMLPIIVLYIQYSNFMMCAGKCGYPEVNQGVVVDHYTFPALSGTSIGFHCHPGLVIIQPTVEVMCNISGQWNPDPDVIECIGILTKFILVPNAYCAYHHYTKSNLAFVCL